MTYELWINTATKKLKDAKIQSARLDALLLLANETNKSLAQILAHPETTLTDEQQNNLSKNLTRRKQFEPIAYIVGYKEFYGREFTVNKHVLVPRPETEDMITLLSTLKSPKNIIDVGTGSGALAITAKLELPDANVFATDNDASCLKIAKNNAKNLNADVNFINTDIIYDIKSDIISCSVILANLPYVPDTVKINNDAKFEPPEAIFSPQGGLWHYKRLFEQLDPLNKPQAIICESLEQQRFDLTLLAAKHGFKLAQKLGLQQLFTPKD